MVRPNVPINDDGARRRLLEEIEAEIEELSAASRVLRRKLGLKRGVTAVARPALRAATLETLAMDDAGGIRAPEIAQRIQRMDTPPACTIDTTSVTKALRAISKEPDSPLLREERMAGRRKEVYWSLRPDADRNRWVR